MKNADIFKSHNEMGILPEFTFHFTPIDAVSLAKQ
jgi:hypothetical protein